MNSFQQAIRIAALKHGASVDKGGQPFIGHPLRVMARMAARFAPVPEYVLEAAALHDVVEDTGTDYQELKVEGISGRAIILVKVLSRTDTESYFEYVARIKTPDLDALAQFAVEISLYPGTVEQVKTSIVIPIFTPTNWAAEVKLQDLADNMDPHRRVEGLKLPERYQRAVAILKGVSNE